MPDVRGLKTRLSPRLLAIRGVVGLGLPGGRLTVYLEEDSEAVRARVREAVEAEEKDAAVDFVVSGRFRAR
jgi:hypothetical protein